MEKKLYRFKWQRQKNPNLALDDSYNRGHKLLCVCTCWRRVLRLEQSHYALAMEAAWAEQHRFSARMFPTHHGQPVVSVAAGHFVQTAVLYCLRDHQEAWVTEGEGEWKSQK